jgi:hypothetical protein
MISSAATLDNQLLRFPDVQESVSRGRANELDEAEPRVRIAEWSDGPRQDAETTVTVQSTRVANVAPWLMRRLEQVQQLRSLPAEWESTGAAPPNADAIGLATRVLLTLSEMGVEPSHIDPSTGEGVCISFEAPERYADIECFNEGFMLAATSRDDGDSYVWDVPPSEIEDALSRILQFTRAGKP